MSSVALGNGSSGTASGGRAVGPAGVSYADGTLTVVGVPKAGDTFTFDLNGTAVSTTFSEVDQYPDNAAGAAAQIKAAVDVLIASSPTTLGNVSVKNNENGTLSFSQGTSATLDTFTGTANTAVIDEANGTVTFTGSTAEAIALKRKRDKRGQSRCPRLMVLLRQTLVRLLPWLKQFKILLALKILL